MILIPQPNPFKDSASSSHVFLSSSVASLRGQLMCRSSPLFTFLILCVEMNYKLPSIANFHMFVSLQLDTAIGSMRKPLLSFPSLGKVKVIEHTQPGSSGPLVIENLLEPYSSKALCKSKHLLKLAFS